MQLLSWCQVVLTAVLFDPSSSMLSHSTFVSCFLKTAAANTGWAYKQHAHAYPHAYLLEGVLVTTPDQWKLHIVTVNPDGVGNEGTDAIIHPCPAQSARQRPAEGSNS
jgi:hypothetical protein